MIMNNEKHHGCCGHSSRCEQIHDSVPIHSCERGKCGGCCKSKCGGITITRSDLEILNELLEYNYLPISRFVMCSSHTDEARFIALAPVYIDDKTDSIEIVKLFGEQLNAMEKKNLISLDYDDALQGYDYEKHRNSDLFHYFEKTVKEGAGKSDYLCDTAELECGSISMTPFGLAAAKHYFGDIE